MKKFFKILGITAAVFVLVLYLAFLFVVPNVVDLNQYKPMIQQIAEEQTNLKLDFKNPKISTTPLLSAGFTADDITISLPDGSQLLGADSVKFRIALSSLLLLTVKTSTAEIQNPYVNIDIVDGKAFKAVSAYEEILNKNEENIEENLQTAQKPIIDPSLIKIIVPALKLINYNVSVNDLKTQETLKLTGEKLVLGYKNGKTASIKTDAALYINDIKNLTANIDIDSFLPEQTKLDEEDDKAQRVEIPFVNPVQMYKEYDLKANIDSKIKVRNKNNQITSNGYFNIDDFSLKLAQMQLPASKFHVKTRGTQINIDTDLYITQEEKISILGLLNYGKNPKTDLKINSSKINPNDVLNLIKATLASLHVKNDLDSLNGSGSFEIDTYIKTNFKKLESSGNITVKDCIIKDVKKNLTLLKANSIISLDNNMLKFVDTSIEVIDTLFKIDGTVDNKSKADLSVIMEKLPLAKVFSFLPAEISGNYSVKSGDININATIKGELKKADADFTLNVAGIDLTDKINKINYKNNQFTAKFTGNLKKITGNITNNGFKLSMNGAAVNCDSISVDISEKDININPAQININNSSVLNLSGSVLNYIKKPAINFDVNGNLVTKDLKQLAGSDIAMYIKEKGALPVNININGDGKKQTLTASIEADKDNYFTPVDIKNTENKNTTLKTVVDFKGDRLKIKDTGFFIKTISQDTENPEKTIVNYEEVVSIDGTITKLNSSTPNINLIKIKIPEELNAVLCVFPQSALKAKGNLFVFGDLDNPRIRGGFNIWDISIPELFLTVDKLAANFEGKNLDVDIKNILANGSDYNILINADLSPSEYFTIKNLNLTSALTDVDKLMKVSDEAMKYVPAQTDTTSSAGAGDIPVIIKDGAIDIKSIKTGNINMTDTTAKISLLNNIFYVNNLITNGFKGKIKGDVSLNLISSEIKAVLKGSGLDVEQALLDAAAMKDTLTGTLDFDTDISLKGATYEEQMKSLAGTVNFAMKNGSLGPFGKLENLILAENIRENSFFQSTIGSILNSLLSFDTAHYNTLNGTVLFKDGVVDISSIKSSGDIMATHIFGDFNLLSNKIDIKLRGKLGSQVSDSMGYLSMVNPVNLVKATPGMSLVFGKIFFLFTETVTEADMAQIPSLGKDILDTNTTKFQVVVRGDVAKPLTLVKSFKWMALQSDIDNANSYVNSISSDTLPAQIEGLTSIDTETVKTEVTEGVKNAVEQAASDSVTQTVEKIQETVTNTMEQSENTKQGILQNLKNKIKNIKTENTSETEE